MRHGVGSDGVGHGRRVVNRRLEILRRDLWYQSGEFDSQDGELLSTPTDKALEKQERLHRQRVEDSESGSKGTP